MALANNPFTDRDYQNWRESQFAHGRAISAQAHDRNMELSSMVERMRGDNAARVAQINADVGMANIEAHKPLLGAQASAINEMLPLKKKLGEQEIETGDINTKLGKLQLGFEPEFLQKKLDFANLGAAGYKTNILSALTEAMKGYKGLKEGNGPSYLNELFGIEAPEVKAAGGEATTGTTPEGKKGSLLSTASYLLPMFGAGLGTAAGAFTSPVTGPVGPYAGGAIGGAGGEYLRQKLMGEDTNLTSIAMSGVGGGVGGKMVAKPLAQLALKTPGVKNLDFLYRIGANL